MATKACAGCGAVLPNGRDHSMVGVSMETGTAVSSPVCLDCWTNPMNRNHTLKMHFFPRQQEAQAVAAAGSANIGG